MSRSLLKSLRERYRREPMNHTNTIKQPAHSLFWFFLFFYAAKTFEITDNFYFHTFSLFYKL